MTRWLLRFKAWDFQTKDEVHDACSENDKEDSGTSLIKWRDVSLWRVLDDLHNAIGADYSIMDNLRAPSVAIGYAVTIDNSVAENRIRFLSLTDKNTIAGMNTIVNYEGVVGVTSDE